jgi:hypothetical protein
MALTLNSGPASSEITMATERLWLTSHYDAAVLAQVKIHPFIRPYCSILDAFSTGVKGD